MFEDLVYYELETVREFTYLDGIVKGGGGCEAAAIVRTKYGWGKFMECE